jgi:hypothetical protein
MGADPLSGASEIEGANAAGDARAESADAEPQRDPWSAEAMLLVRPFRTYRALAGRRSERTWRDLARGLLLEGALLGGFVSLTSAGRLVLGHVVFTALFWGFLPVLQIAAISAAVRATAPRERLVPALSLYFEGLGPWYVFYLVLPAICLFAPDVYGAMTALLRTGALPLYLLGTIAWGGVITWAFLREGLGLGRGRAGVAAAIFYAIFLGVVVGYYLACNEIQPQIWGAHA